MTEQQDKSPVGDMMKDPNIGLIGTGALVWILSFYVPFIGPLLSTGGFALVCLASAVTALKRPIDKAMVGLIMGAIIQIVGGYLAGVFLIGWILSPILTVVGGVMIIFFSIPLVVQTGKIPFVEEFQEAIKKQAKEDEEPSEETTDTTDEAAQGQEEFSDEGY
ncbi:hypothetical protein EU537_11435 [Candidatus Thorarchaeota archaeon]|nr:MAG: hypothetical protein EU537_11435 [Candidatus Thorarchaeota archaeon]